VKPTSETVPRQHATLYGTIMLPGSKQRYVVDFIIAVLRLAGENRLEKNKDTH
jgi:hypothetical protein